MNSPRKYTKHKDISTKERQELILKNKYFVSWFIEQVISCENSGVSRSHIMMNAPVRDNNTITHLSKALERYFDLYLCKSGSKYYVDSTTLISTIIRKPSITKKRVIKTCVDSKKKKSRGCFDTIIQTFLKKYPSTNLKQTLTPEPESSLPCESLPTPYESLPVTPITPLSIWNSMDSLNVGFDIIGMDIINNVLNTDYNSPPVTVVNSPLDTIINSPLVVYTPVVKYSSTESFLDDVEQLFEQNKNINVDKNNDNDKFLEWLFDF